MKGIVEDVQWYFLKSKTVNPDFDFSIYASSIPFRRPNPPLQRLRNLHFIYRDLLDPVLRLHGESALGSPRTFQRRTGW